MAIVAAVWRAGAINTDNTQGDSVFATKSCPAPSSKACGVRTRAHAKLTSFSIRKNACATPLGPVTQARVGVVGCNCTGFLWLVGFLLEVEASEVGQAAVGWEAAPIEAELLDHGAAWAEALDGCEKIIQFGRIVRVDWKSVYVDANSSEDVLCNGARVIAVIWVG